MEAIVQQAVRTPATAQTARGPIEYLASGEGPALLALHGAMGGYDQSDILARTVAPAGFRHIAVSRPGYLGTPLEVGRSPEDQADAYAALLDALGIQETVVMAISGGGPSAIHFALRHAARCRRLVLISTCGAKTESRIPLSFRIMEFLARWPAVVRRMQKKARQNLEKNLMRSIPDPAVVARVMQDPEVRVLVEELMFGMFDRMAERLPGTDNDIRVARSCEYPLEQVAVPTLVIHGMADPLVPFERHGQVLAGRIRGAQLVALKGGGHMSIFTHRAEVRFCVEQFLELQGRAR